ncbi:MAG: hypothetical protein RMI30_00300 [Thermodesulfovibrio sp.]|nr:hypothetical protein [Thermodesulfovibrio sp.]MDW7997882.1 hypothetical protein [Thermodesulfovibrio sp.]
MRYIRAEHELLKIFDSFDPLTSEEIEHRSKLLEDKPYKLTGLWLGLAHLCNLGCSYCFANTPYYLQNHRPFMCEETSKRAIVCMMLET